MNTTTMSSTWQFLRRRKRKVFFVVLIMVCFFITANVCLYHRSTCLTVAELWLTPAARNISVNGIRLDSEEDPASLKIQMTFVNKSDETVFLLRGHRREYRFINVRTPWGMALPQSRAVAESP